LMGAGGMKGRLERPSSHWDPEPDGWVFAGGTAFSS